MTGTCHCCAVVRPFRFGLQLPLRTLADDPIALSCQAELAGFDVVLMGDHIGPEFAPLPTLGAIAAATRSIGVGTMVVNADLCNPVQLAWEAATLARLSAGRFELGLGAGHTPQEYLAVGRFQDRPAVRKRRLMESFGIIQRLLRGEVVRSRGEFFEISGAQVTDTEIPVPLLIGGNGEALLRFAGRHADAVGLQGLGRTEPDGHRHDVNWTVAHLDRQLDQIHAGAGRRFGDIELSALVQVVDITDDADAAIARLCKPIPSLGPGDAANAPYALIGTVDEIVDKLLRCRERWGISYFVVRDLEHFPAVIEPVRKRTE